VCVVCVLHCFVTVIGIFWWTSMAEESNIGNYKGVMLCNRPVGPTGGDVGTRGGDGKPPPFKAGIPAERVNPRGYDPGLIERIVAAKDSDSVGY
jgi:hypothetical protein